MDSCREENPSVCPALDKHIQKLYEYAEETDIVIAGLRDLEINHLAEELHTIKGQLIDTIWDIESVLGKEEE